MTIVFGTPGGTIFLVNFKPSGVKRRDFKINIKEIVLALVFKSSRGSFFKVLGDSKFQIHI